MITAVDTNILLDILIPNTRHIDVSQQWLDESLAQGALVICEVVYAELASQFSDPEALDQFLFTTRIRLDHAQPEALQQSADAWRNFLKRRRKGIQCPQCGQNQQITCIQCETHIPIRQHILSDFLIGGHASIQADCLLTRDLGYYKSYFPELALYA